VAGHLELLDGFYEVFARNMRDLGTPVYAKNFFHNILEAFPEGDIKKLPENLLRMYEGAALREWSALQSTPCHAPLLSMAPK